MQHILETIKARHIAMRPKWHFVLKSSLKVLGIIMLFLTIIFMASFILFVLRATGVLFVPLFGFRAISLLFALL